MNVLKGRVLQSAVLSSVLFAASTTAFGAVQRTPGEPVRQLGIASYLAEEGRDSKVIELRLLGLRHQDLGQVRIEVGFDGDRHVVYRRNGSTHEVFWNAEAREVTFSVNGRKVLLQVVDEAWVASQGETLLIGQNRKAFEIAARVLSDFEDEARVIERVHGLLPLEEGLSQDFLAKARQACKTGSPSSPAILTKDCGGSVNRGDSTATTRSACCEEANDEVQGDCWNSRCVGCCSTGSCDAACAIGDYFCVCGVSGTECGAAQ
jgi:hypothetical protein